MRTLVVIVALLAMVAPADAGVADWLGARSAKRIIERTIPDASKPPSRVQGVPDRIPGETAEQRYRRFCEPVATIPECPNYGR